MDAFVHARFPIGSMSLIIHGGQFAQQWGQTLFFGGNGIAGAMAPMDIEKLMMVPNSEFKEAIRPVPQVSMNLQVNPKLSLAAYYQLGWEGDRFPAVGRYFSSSDVTGGRRTLGFPNLWSGHPSRGPADFGAYPDFRRRVPCSRRLWLVTASCRTVGAKDWGQFGVSAIDLLSSRLRTGPIHGPVPREGLRSSMFSPIAGNASPRVGWRMELSVAMRRSIRRTSRRSA